MDPEVAQKRKERNKQRALKAQRLLLSNPEINVNMKYILFGKN